MKEFKNIGEAVKRYVSLRDRLRAWQHKKKEEEAIKKIELEGIEMWLINRADEDGVESFKTRFGTAYKTYSEHYNVADWTTFVDYVKETGNFQLFQKRVTSTAAKEIHEETGELPPGLNFFKEVKMGVLRPKGGEVK